MSFAALQSELLAARDRRDARIREAAGSGTREGPVSVLCLGTNVPGPVKDRPGLNGIFSRFALRALKAFSGAGPQGQEGFAVVARGSDALGPYLVARVIMKAATLKLCMVAMEEETAWARLLDADVYDLDGRQIDRDALSLPPRSCLLCHEPARECMLLRRHRSEDLIRACDALIDAAGD